MQMQYHTKGVFHMKKSRIFLVTLLLISLLAVPASFAEADSTQELVFDKAYMLLPEMDLRADPDTPGKVDTISA